jgi:hypothetical protein
VLMATTSESALPRHACVVPAFVAAMIRRPLDVWFGKIQPRELPRWERQEDLTETGRWNLRHAIVRRIRVRGERLWTHRVNVRLVDSWRAHLTAADRVRVEALVLLQDVPLENWTLRKVRDTPRLPLGQTLALLARLKAVHWEPPAFLLQPSFEYDPEQGQTVPVTPELRERAQDALALPWFCQVSPHDLRFGRDINRMMPAWITTQLHSAMRARFYAGSAGTAARG